MRCLRVCQSLEEQRQGERGLNKSRNQTMQICKGCNVPVEGSNGFEAEKDSLR